VLLGIFVLVAAASLQTVGAHYCARVNFSVDPLLVCSLCCAMLAGDAAALSVAVCAGIFKDLFSAGVFGQSVAAFIPVALMVSRMRRALWTGHWTTQAGIAFAGTVLVWCIYSVLAEVRGEPIPQGAGAAFLSALANAFIAPPLFHVWRAITG
jgi:cell shape-determining protein MreD